MIFTDIRLQNYRSYEDASFELGAGVNIVVGPNAAGKTNLLEGLMLAAVGRSYRAKDALLVRSEASWARIDVHTSSNETRVVKLAQSPEGKTEKTFEFDDKTYKRMTNGQRQPVVLFEPNDLQLLHAEPTERRSYLDNLLEQYEVGYASLRASLRRILAQRNALLKQPGRAQEQIFAWNVRLCDIASQIVAARTRLVELLDNKINETYSSIAGKDLKVGLRYESKTNLENYSSHLMRQLEQGLEQDIYRGFTSYGPHRDDLILYFGDAPANNSASRGETRTLLLALKIIELQILEEKTGKRPLLLLDDVFSELDGARRRALTDYLKSYQTIITTTDADVVLKDFKPRPTIIAIG
jgi:DNA replication and repair protein RecF